MEETEDDIFQPEDPQYMSTRRFDRLAINLIDEKIQSQELEQGA